MSQFRYFMIRVRDAGDDIEHPATLKGVVERLGSGEKRAFGNANELLHLVATWKDPSENAGGVGA